MLLGDLMTSTIPNVDLVPITLPFTVPRSLIAIIYTSSLLGVELLPSSRNNYLSDFVLFCFFVISHSSKSLILISFINSMISEMKFVKVALAF